MKTLFALFAAVALWIPAQAQLAPPNDAGVTMGHVHLNVADVDVQQKFWTKHFGAVPLKKPGLPGVKVPGMLILFEKQTPTGGSEGTSMDHFGFKVPNTAEALKSFRADGIKVESEFKGTEGFPNAYVMGPDDVKIELQEDTSLKVPSLAYHLHFMNAPGDQVKLMNWYAQTFGATVKKRGQHDAADIPGMNLTFGVTKTPPMIGTKGRSMDHIGFEVKNLEAFCKNLSANGVKFDVPYMKIPSLGIGLAFFTDPFGTYIELTEGLDQY